MSHHVVQLNATFDKKSFEKGKSLYFNSFVNRIAQIKMPRIIFNCGVLWKTQLETQVPIPFVSAIN